MTASKMKLPLIILLSQFMLLACSKSNDAANAAAMQMPPMPVSIVQVKPTSVPISVEAVAQTEGAKQVEIRPRVGGILLKKLFEEGAPIKAGQAMFLIDPVPYQIALQQAKAMLEQQKSRVEQTAREAHRLQALLATQSISQREADNAVSDNALANAALAQYEASVREANLNLSYTTVTSPISGIAGRFEYSEGTLVSANSSLLTTVSQISPIWVRFSLSDSELASVGGRVSTDKAQDVQIVLPDGKVYPKSGKINFSASTIDPQYGTQQLRATFDNQDKALLPGQFVRVRVTTGQKEGVFLVPQTAISTGEQGMFVFVVNAKNQAERRPVTVGEWKGTDWVILSGLQAGDNVITDNLIKLNMMPPGAPVSPHVSGAAPGASDTKSEANK
jgi:membrane fusion protein (multidrug efflux system)